MAEMYLKIENVKEILQNWIEELALNKNDWGRIDIHIDEIVGLKKLKRSDWVDVSFKVLNILSEKIESIAPFKTFLHIELKYSKKNEYIDILTLNWLSQNIGEYTPPSLHVTSLEYFEEFYLKKLVACKPDKSILDLIKSSVKVDFYYRTYFDEDEELYSRQIYLFVENKETNLI